MGKCGWDILQKKIVEHACFLLSEGHFTLVHISMVTIFATKYFFLIFYTWLLSFRKTFHIRMTNLSDHMTGFWWIIICSFFFFFKKFFLKIFYKNGLLNIQAFSLRKTLHIRMHNLSHHMIVFLCVLNFSFCNKMCHLYILQKWFIEYATFIF